MPFKESIFEKHRTKIWKYSMTTSINIEEYFNRTLPDKDKEVLEYINEVIILKNFEELVSYEKRYASKVGKRIFRDKFILENLNHGILRSLDGHFMIYWNYIAKSKYVSKELLLSLVKSGNWGSGVSPRLLLTYQGNRFTESERKKILSEMSNSRLEKHLPFDNSITEEEIMNYYADTSLNGPSNKGRKTIKKFVQENKDRFSDGLELWLELHD